MLLDLLWQHLLESELGDVSSMILILFLILLFLKRALMYPKSQAQK